VQRVVESEQMYHKESEDLGGANSSYRGVKRGAGWALMLGVCKENSHGSPKMKVGCWWKGSLVKKP